MFQPGDLLICPVLREIDGIIIKVEHDHVMVKFYALKQIHIDSLNSKNCVDKMTKKALKVLLTPKPGRDPSTAYILIKGS